MFRIRLKELREKTHLSQKQLADKLGISQGTVGNWESGIREPNFQTVTKLAKYFNVSIDYLLGTSTPDSSDDDNTNDSVFFRLKKELEPYDIDDNDVTFLTEVLRLHKEKNK